MSSLTIRTASLLSVLICGLLSDGATRCMLYLLESIFESTFPVVLVSMTTMEFSGTFSMNSWTPSRVVLKTNVFVGESSTCCSVLSLSKTHVVQLFLCASIPTLIIPLLSSLPFVLFCRCHGSETDNLPYVLKGQAGRSFD